MISSCPNYLYADVSDGEDLSRHQQEVTDGKLVTMSLVPSTVDPDVTLECHLCCPPPLTYKGGVLLGQQLRTLCLETELEKRKKSCGCPCLFPLLRGIEWELGQGGKGM